MFEHSMSTALFAGLAAFFGFVLSFIILKLFGVDSPIESKLFYPIFGVVMLLAYILRSAF